MSGTRKQVQPFVLDFNGSKLATFTPFASVVPLMPAELVANQQYILSRFAYIHNQDNQMVLESPLAHAKVILHDWRVSALLHNLAQPQRLETLCREFQCLSSEIIFTFLSWLLGGEFLIVTDQKENIQQGQSLIQWDFHDLLFHTRSRLGRHDYLYGKSDRHHGKIEPLPAVKSLMSNQGISLYKPDLQALMENDIPLTRVMEQRRSLRQYGKQPITAEQLGEFLYRTARLRSRTETEQVAYEYSDRPYPNSGACYELELYVVVNICQQLHRGLYHYCPNEHVLCKLTDYTWDIVKLLCNAATQESMPEILIILTARFQRVAWKYSSIAYSLILKNVGVLYQSMYLVATAMNLSPCAIGGGDSDLFAKVAGTDYYIETSVGEFILGNKSD